MFFAAPLGRDQAQGGTQGGPQGRRPLPGPKEVCGREQGHARGQGRPSSRGSLQAEEEVVWTKVHCFHIKLIACVTHAQQSQGEKTQAFHNFIKFFLLLIIQGTSNFKRK